MKLLLGEDTMCVLFWSLTLCTPSCVDNQRLNAEEELNDANVSDVQITNDIQLSDIQPINDVQIFDTQFITDIQLTDIQLINDAQLNDIQLVNDAQLPDIQLSDAAEDVCPRWSTAVERCLPDDPLCWTLVGDQACLSTLCPVNNPCVDGQPVEICPPDAQCFENTICGSIQICVPPSDCDTCEASCQLGTRQVEQCSLGEECQRISECCSELYCEVCDRCDPDCHRLSEDQCPPFTRQVLSECQQDDPYCWTIQDAETTIQCLSMLCMERIPPQPFCNPESRVENANDCDDQVECEALTVCANTIYCRDSDGPGMCDVEEGPFECPPGGEEIEECQPNGLRCDAIDVSCYEYRHCGYPATCNH